MDGLKRRRLLSHNKLVPINDEMHSNCNSHTEYPAITYGKLIITLALNRLEP